MIAALITYIVFVTNELDNQTKTQGKYKLKYGLTGRLISFYVLFLSHAPFLVVKC